MCVICTTTTTQEEQGEQEEQEDEDEEEEDEQEEEVDIQQWVVVQYDGVQYPGEVMSIDLSECDAQK